MAIAQHNKILASDVQALINRLAAEEARRSYALGDAPAYGSCETPTIGDKIDQSARDVEYRRRRVDSNNGTYVYRCGAMAWGPYTTGTAYVGIWGYTRKSFSDLSTSLEVSDIIYNSTFQTMITDIGTLEGQTISHTTTQCDCNGECCNWQGCTWGCSNYNGGNRYQCGCHYVCTCYYN